MSPEERELIGLELTVHARFSIRVKHEKELKRLEGEFRERMTNCADKTREIKQLVETLKRMTVEIELARKAEKDKLAAKVHPNFDKLFTSFFEGDNETEGLATTDAVTGAVKNRCTSCQRANEENKMIKNPELRTDGGHQVLNPGPGSKRLFSSLFRDSSPSV